MYHLKSYNQASGKCSSCCNLKQSIYSSYLAFYCGKQEWIAGRKQALHPNAFFYPGLYVCCWVAVTQAAGGSQKCLCGERSSFCCASVFGTVTQLLWSLLGPGGDAEDLIRTGTVGLQPAVRCVPVWFHDGYWPMSFTSFTSWWLHQAELPTGLSAKTWVKFAINECGSSLVSFVQMLMGGREGPVPLSHCNPTAE